VLFTGEGSHQLTANDIGTMGRNGLKPIIFVLNNAGYMVERALEANPDWVYNDLAPWNYHALPAALGCQGWFTAKVTTGTVVREGAKVGAWAGGIFGLLVGAAFLILPGVGPVIAFCPLSVALLGGLEGALAGAAFGGLTGALVGLGVSKDKAIRYESQVKAGKFLVTLQGDGP
jgi:hypothetical protein